MPHRKDEIGELLWFVRSQSRFYHKQYKNLPGNVQSVRDIPITNSRDYWAKQDDVKTAAITTDMIMRAGSPTDPNKKVYLTKDELATAQSVCANALVAYGTGLQPGDRVANIAHQGSPHGSFTILPTLLPSVPVSVVHLPTLDASEGPEKIISFLQVYEATVLLATFSTAKRIAAFGTSLPNLRLVMYSGGCFHPTSSPINTHMFPNAVVRPSEFANMAAGLIGIPVGEDKNTFKVLEPLVIVELVRSDGKVIRENGVRGKVVVTHLVRRLQPLVRFPTGDTAEWVDRSSEILRVRH